LGFHPSSLTIHTTVQSYREHDHHSLRLLGWVEMLGGVDAGVNAINTLPCADVSVNRITELTAGGRLPDAFQRVCHRDRFPNSRLYRETMT